MGSKLSGNRTVHPNTQGNRKPTPRQKAAALILVSNPDMPLGEALILAGYSQSAKKNPNLIINSKAITSLKAAYNYELSSRINPRLIARKMKQGINNPDSKVVLEYIKEVKKDLGLSSDQATNAIQINLTGGISELAE